MVFAELLFLVVFWAWFCTAVLFLRQTFLPRAPFLSNPMPWPPTAVQAVTFLATDGVRLSGWKVGVDPARPWILLCHGLGANRTDLLEIAAGLTRASYNVFLFDFRAHGESAGRSTSFGWLERRDVEGALAFLGAQPDIPDRPYGILGVSMGGSVAIMVAAGDERLGAVAVDSIYSNLEDSLAHHLTMLYRLPRVPFGFFVNTAYRLRFGVWPSRMAPIASVGRISPRPILIIHGEQDPRMPANAARALFEAAGNPKDLWMVPTGEHLGGFYLHPETYLRRLIGFFDSHLSLAEKSA